MSDILSVVAAAPDRMLATAGDVRPWLVPSDSPSDDELKAQIARTSDVISDLCGGRVFARETVREIFRAAGRMKPLILARHPVAAVISVVADGATLAEGTDFEVEADAGIAHRLSGGVRCVWRATTVTIEYAAGWLLPSQDQCDLPGTLRDICINRVVRARGGKGRDPNIRSESTEGIDSISFFDPNKLSVEEDKILAPYRIHCR